MFKRGFVGRGMHLEFSHRACRAPITTSRIEEIRECPRRATVAPPIAMSWRVESRTGAVAVVSRWVLNGSDSRKPSRNSIGSCPLFVFLICVCTLTSAQRRA